MKQNVKINLEIACSQDKHSLCENYLREERSKAVGNLRYVNVYLYESSRIEDNLHFLRGAIQKICHGGGKPIFRIPPAPLH